MSNSPSSDERELNPENDNSCVNEGDDDDNVTMVDAESQTNLNDDNSDDNNDDARLVIDEDDTSSVPETASCNVAMNSVRRLQRDY